MKCENDLHAHTDMGEVSPTHHPLKQPAVIISPVDCTSEHGNYPTLNPKFSAISTPCPHCHKVSLETAYQPPLVATKPGYMMTHCKNKDCTHYALTLRHERFMEGK